MKTSFWLLLGFISFSSMSADAQETIRKALYGNDSRVEVANHSDRRLRSYANSVAGMVRNYQLTSTNPTPQHMSLKSLNFEIERMLEEGEADTMGEAYELVMKSMGMGRSESEGSLTNSDSSNFLYFRQDRTLRRAMNVCESERFADQPVLPSCSGFLIADDLLVTAGHCIENEFQCRSTSWIFGFYDGVGRIRKNDVYRCKELVSQSLVSNLFMTADFAVVRLERAATGRSPLPVRTTGTMTLKNTELAMIGHPSGLPMKIADGATVNSFRVNFFTTDLDAFSGNSGSPVINQTTGIVEGILIEGADDYTFNSDLSCYETNTMSARNRGEEKVFRINRIPNLRNLVAR